MTLEMLRAGGVPGLICTSREKADWNEAENIAAVKAKAAEASSVLT
jgi:hypothetical protein